MGSVCRRRATSGGVEVITTAGEHPAVRTSPGVRRARADDPRPVSAVRITVASPAGPRSCPARPGARPGPTKPCAAGRGRCIPPGTVPVAHARSEPHSVRREALHLRDGALRIVAVADTHGRPHPGALAHIAALEPQYVLHAGDVGELAVLSELERIAPVFAVRGANIDAKRRRCRTCAPSRSTTATLCCSRSRCCTSPWPVPGYGSTPPGSPGPRTPRWSSAGTRTCPSSAATAASRCSTSRLRSARAGFQLLHRVRRPRHHAGAGSACATSTVRPAPCGRHRRRSDPSLS